MLRTSHCCMQVIKSFSSMQVVNHRSDCVMQLWAKTSSPVTTTVLETTITGRSSGFPWTPYRVDSLLPALMSGAGASQCGRFLQGEIISRSFWSTLYNLCSSRAQQPFPDVDPFEMEGYLVDGFRLHQPVNCPDQLYTVSWSLLHFSPFRSGCHVQPPIWGVW